MHLYRVRLNVATVLALTAGIAHAATQIYDFNITWVLANPDGGHVRPTIGINGQWPIPVIRCERGDRVIVNVHNQLGNQTTSLHFHGLLQNGTSDMDGSAGVTQCSIPAGASFQYNFTVEQPGTYWYHSHDMGQYPDGLRGAFIVHDPLSPYQGQYDEEVTLTVSDWYHDQMPPLIAKFLGVTNPAGVEPIPNAVLLNDTRHVEVSMQPKRTYLFRVINMGAFASQYLWFEEHAMTIVEVDGVYTQPAEADMLYLTSGQRCSFLITAKENADRNLAFVTRMDREMFDKAPDGLEDSATGWLVYDSAKARPSPAARDTLRPFDDIGLVPYDQAPLLAHVDRSITLNVGMNNLGDGAKYAFFNDITYLRPTVPTLYTALSTGRHALDGGVYGANSNAHVLAKGEVIEIVVNNADAGKHPFHLHGHTFQVVHRSEAEAGSFDPNANTTAISSPLRRDTVMVHPGGNVVLRFVANNPDKWWPIMPSGIGCRAAGVPTVGNAAGHTRDVFDLTGASRPPAPLPSGSVASMSPRVARALMFISFTTRGIVALVFSVLSAVVGLAVVAW
ncbi:MAG: hypothetical protein M1826_002864 [Phylliscum demangeonii]|nr:MAG: hypothetical protein M1826_002864 [Phylliscum demangeonii]